jgi:hypothetical protein
MTNLITSFVGKEFFVCKENDQKRSVGKWKGYSGIEGKRRDKKIQIFHGKRIKHKSIASST